MSEVPLQAYWINPVLVRVESATGETVSAGEDKASVNPSSRNQKP